MAKEKKHDKYKSKRINQEAGNNIYFSDSDQKAFRKRKERKKRVKQNKRLRKLQRAASKKS